MCPLLFCGLRGSFVWRAGMCFPTSALLVVLTRVALGLHSLIYDMGLTAVPATREFVRAEGVDILYVPLLNSLLTKSQNGEGQYCVVGESTDGPTRGKFIIFS